MSGQSPPTGLRRSLNLAHAIFYGLGVTIGAGIYVLVGVAAERSGALAPAAFLVAAFLLLFSAASFSELGSRLPVAASEAAYIEAAFNRNWLTLAVGLLVVGAATVSAATISVGGARYLSAFIPLPLPMLIVGVVLAMGMIAMLPTAQSVTLASLMTLIEIGGLMMVIVPGILSPETYLRLPEAIPDLSAHSWSHMADTALIAVFAFIGFEHLVNISEEMKSPRRTLPIALFITLTVTALIYATVVWVSIVAVPVQELAGSVAPLALVFQRLTGLPLVVLGGIAAIATLNGVIIHMIMIGRVLYGLASGGRLPKWLATLNPRTQIPISATLLGIAVILMLAMSFKLTGLADLTSRATLLIFTLVNIALVRIKMRETTPPDGIFVAPMWAPVMGAVCSGGLLVDSLMGP